MRRGSLFSSVPSQAVQRRTAGKAAILSAVHMHEAHLLLGHTGTTTVPAPLAHREPQTETSTLQGKLRGTDKGAIGWSFHLNARWG
jgi:hypothetical protein